MNRSTPFLRTGALCGIASILSYVAAAFVPMPDILGYAAAFAFGPLLAVGAMGLYHSFPPERRGPLVQIATFLAMAGGITVLVKLTTQQAIFGVMQTAIKGAVDPATADAYRKVADGLDAVHFGIDVAWDVLISAATILLGIAMIRHPLYGRIFGGIGTLLGSLLLGFNLWYFPIPPASSDSIDFGPFVALWILAAFIILLRAGFRPPAKAEPAA